MKNARFVFLFVGCIAIMSGCAVGNTHRYHDTIAQINATGSNAIVVATHDQREYVLSGKKDASFVGVQRGGFGNPFSITTASGKPLAEDMTQAIVNSLANKGFKSIPVAVGHQEDRQAVISKLKTAGGERFVIFTLKQWRSDTYQNTRLDYDVKAEVVDLEGNTVAEKQISGSDDLKGSVLNPPKHAKKAVPVAFKEKIEILLNSEKISAAL